VTPSGKIFGDALLDRKVESMRETEPEEAKITVIIGDRLREMREEKKLSQGDIEKRTGLLRCYISGSRMDTRSRPSKH